MCIAFSNTQRPSIKIEPLPVVWETFSTFHSSHFKLRFGCFHNSSPSSASCPQRFFRIKMLRIYVYPILPRFTKNKATCPTVIVTESIRKPLKSRGFNQRWIRIWIVRQSNLYFRRYTGLNNKLRSKMITYLKWRPRHHPKFEV